MKGKQPCRNQGGAAEDLLMGLAGMVFDLIGILAELLWRGGKAFFTWYFDTNREKLIPIEQKDVANKRSSSNPDMLGYSVNRKRELLLTDLDCRMHNLIIGASGFGKTNTLALLFQKDLMQNRPIIFFDPKASRESLLQFKALCNFYNKKCHVFSNYYSGHSYFNPLKEGEADQVVQRIMDSFEWDNSFYKGVAEAELLRIVLALKREGREVTYVELYRRCSKDDDLIGLNNQLMRITSSSFGKLFDPPDGKETLTINQIRERQECLYVGIPTQGFGNLARTMGKIFVGELLYHSNHYQTASNDSHTVMNKPISVYFDEAGSIIIPDFLELINKCRSSGIQCTTCVQSLSDLDRISPELKDGIAENSSSNMIIFKQTVPKNVEFLVNVIGTMAGKKETKMMSDGEDLHRGSVREVQEFICSPSVIKQLSIGQGILVRREPFLVDLVNFRNTRESEIFKTIEQEAAKEELISDDGIPKAMSAMLGTSNQQTFKEAVDGAIFTKAPTASS